MESFYLAIDVLFFMYACHSWYYQASLEVKGVYRRSLLIWTLLVIMACSYADILVNTTEIRVFLALMILTSIIDGYTGFGAKRLVVSGFFRRTVKYELIQKALVVNLFGEESSCILSTKDGRQYYLRFKIAAPSLIQTLRRYLGPDVEIKTGPTLL